MDVVRTVAELRQCVRDWRADGDSIGLVPTMGALHAGHLSLVRGARELADRTCVTLFVNPAQFGPNEDFDVYPRDEQADAAALEREHADLLFAPGVDDMYPEGDVTRVTVPELGDILEGSFRPGFFTGVATVVTKLLLQALPDAAVFGEKDYQQLQVIRRIVRDLHIPVRIVGAATVREEDGLALSSRNAYLSGEERRIAPALYRTITSVASAVAAGADVAEQERNGVEELLAAGFDKVDYVSVRDGISLAPLSSSSQAGRVLAAAHLGRTRLIDNFAV